MGKKKANKETGLAFSFILQFSINMILPILSLTALGYYIDTKVGTSFLVIVGFFLGALTGATTIYKMSRVMIKKDELSPNYPVVDTKTNKKKEEASDNDQSTSETK